MHFFFHFVINGSLVYQNLSLQIMSEYRPSGKKKARDGTFTTKPNSKITYISSFITS